MFSAFFLIMFTLSLAYAQLEVFNLKVFDKHKKDQSVFTQGLYFYKSQLYESSGRYGQSYVRRLSISNQSLQENQKLPLKANYFAEGASYCRGEHFLLTWKSGDVMKFDSELQKFQNAFKISGEGWGLTCYNNRLLLSNGSSSIYELDPQSGRVLREMKVQAQGMDFDKLNELEVVGDFLLMNRWYENEILVFHLKQNRLIEIWLNNDLVSSLSSSEQQNLDSFNGIAWNSDTQSLWLTGKLWPVYFEVKIPKGSRVQP